MEEKQRQIAYKVWLADIVNSEFVHTSGEWEPNYSLIQVKNVSRVNLLVTVVGKMPSEDNSSTLLDVDNGSATLSLRVWGEDIHLFDGVSVGDFILVIGKIRDYQSKVYVTPEIVKRVDSEWMKVRKLELGRKPLVQTMSSSVVSSSRVEEAPVFEEEAVVEDVVSDSPRSKVLELVSSSSEGIKISVLKDAMPGVETILEDLINEGEVYTVGDIV